MSNTRVAVALALALVFLSLACQGKYPTTENLEFLTVEGSSIQFIREKPEIPVNRVYRAALGIGILTLQDNCFRLDEDGPVIIWPPGFTPHINDGVIEVHDAKGELMARVGYPLEIGGGILKRDAGNCSGPTWVDTRRAEKPTPKTPSWPSPDDPPVNP